ncbi:hypothetical protein [Haliscomenobacter sp.]|uniref:hypothetical protein n=1 Tax=Haliscomenobacter sp. TaxID=2717303 RepID=UPI003BA87F89
MEPMLNDTIISSMIDRELWIQSQLETMQNQLDLIRKSVEDLKSIQCFDGKSEDNARVELTTSK